MFNDKNHGKEKEGKEKTMVEIEIDEREMINMKD